MKSEDEGRSAEPSSYQLQPPHPPESTTRPSAGPTSSSDTSPQPDHPAPGGAAGVGPADGRVLANRYRLLRRLGRGGMGTVWRAHDQLVGRDVAVKEPWMPGPVPERERQTLYDRMRREARTAANIHHASVVTVHDVVIEDERPWIVMELIQGESLSDVLDRGPLDEPEAARIGLAVLGALVAAHRHQVLHRDVKPSNVLLGAEGRVVLTDFGIAKVEGEQGLTQAGAFVGSPTHTAPERVLGQPPGPPSDLWSLGVLLYSAVEGVSPFQRSNAPATLHAVLSEEPPTPSRASELMATLISQLLRKEPAARPAPEEIQRVLTEAAQRDISQPHRHRLAGPDPRAAGTLPPPPSSTSGCTAPHPVPGPPPGPPTRGRTVRRAWIAAGALVLVAALVAAALVFFRDSDGKPEAGDGTASSGAPSTAPSDDPDGTDPDGTDPDDPDGAEGSESESDAPEELTWEVHDETDLVQGSIPAPEGYQRSQDDNEVEYSSEDGEWTFGLDHFDDAEGDAVNEANYRLDWYKNIDNYGWEKVHGWVNPTDYEGYDAARLDAGFAPENDPDTRGRISELVVVDGPDHWHFYLIAPDQDEADREYAQQLFEEALSQLVIDGE